MDTKEKYNRLEDIIREMGEITVAYSGGVDSTFLLRVATNVLKEKCLGVLAVSPTLASRERERAIQVAESIGARLRIISSLKSSSRKRNSTRGFRSAKMLIQKPRPFAFPRRAG